FLTVSVTNDRQLRARIVLQGARVVVENRLGHVITPPRYVPLMRPRYELNGCSGGYRRRHIDLNRTASRARELSGIGGNDGDGNCAGRSNPGGVQRSRHT